MAHQILFLSFLVAFAAMQGCHAVKYVVINNASDTAGGLRFNKEIGVLYSKLMLRTATNFIWTTFHQNNVANDYRKNVSEVRVFIKSMEVHAVSIQDNEIYVNANYIGNFSDDDVKREFTGLLYYAVTIVWQWNGNGQAPQGLLVGIADFARLIAGYAPSHWQRPGLDGKWDQGYSVTAWFLDYLNGLRRDIVAELNKKMKTGYNDSYFYDLLGKTVDQLWSDYKAKYAN